MVEFLADALIWAVIATFVLSAVILMAVIWGGVACFLWECLHG